MSKQVSAPELAKIVSDLLTDPATIASHLDERSHYASFMTDIARTVCEHMGGEVRHPADDFTGEFLVGVHGDDSVPEDGGIWVRVDPEGELFDPGDSASPAPVKTSSGSGQSSVQP